MERPTPQGIAYTSSWNQDSILGLPYGSLKYIYIYIDISYDKLKYFMGVTTFYWAAAK